MILIKEQEVRIYKNMIGFKLIKAIIPNKAYTITKNNNVIIYNASLSGSSTSIWSN